MIKKRVQYQEAYRASAIEIQKRVQAGFSLEEAQEYGTAIYHQVLTNPSKEVRERMTQIALKETFQSPTGEAWSKAFSHLSSQTILLEEKKKLNFRYIFFKGFIIFLT